MRTDIKYQIFAQLCCSGAEVCDLVVHKVGSTEVKIIEYRIGDKNFFHKSKMESIFRNYIRFFVPYYVSEGKVREIKKEEQTDLFEMLQIIFK